jgi:uncharacterized protein (DUF983 family)
VQHEESAGTMTASPPKFRPARADTLPRPPLWTAVGRGALCRCPACGQGRLFCGYLRVATACEDCGARLGEVRADDAPPYFTIFLVGHIVVPLMLLAERDRAPDLWLMAGIFLPLTLLLCLLFLRPVKGATLGLMLALGMSGREQGPDLPDRPG